MRLLQHSKNGDFSLIEAFEDDIPTYAILSHRWGVEEITYQDLTGGTYKRKAGYRKMRFCSQQAQHDGLQHFWIDTCCIDKTNSTELAEAINSMFSWYRKAAKCYVYMPDVSQPRSDPTEKFKGDWNADFRKSEWFTRGWTLQELVAPASVEFFSKEGTRLGDKVSLEKLVSDITRIPGKVLRGSPLFEFSIHERMSWAADRKTFRPEDKAYSLLGIFNVHMPLLYSEGVDKAMQRLREEIDKASKGRNPSKPPQPAPTDTCPDVGKLLTCPGVNREDFLIPISLVDAPHLEQFVARKTELLEIHKALSGDGSRRTVILHGLGGIGKTQLSVAYAKHYRHSYSAVFWLNIDDENAIKQSFVRLARQINQRYPSALRLADTNSRETPEEAIKAVKTWLSQPNNTRWLMIFDNYDNPKLPSSNADSPGLDIRQYLPESYQGSVIITTRSSQIKIGHSIQIQKFENICDSLDILTSVSKREELKDDPDIRKLIRKLDGLPLALATAGSYLNQMTLTVSDYMRLYDDSWAQLQQSSPRLVSYEDRTFYSTWQLSFDQIRQQNDLSAKLLGFWAYFDSQDLWLELLQHTDSSDPEWIRELTKNEISFHETVRMLSNYGLVETNTSTYSSETSESRGYSMHRCVHSWAIHVVNQSMDQELAGLAAKFITNHVSKHLCSRSLTLRRILQHALRCSNTILDGLRLNYPDSANRIEDLGHLFLFVEKPIEAEKMFQQTLRERKQVLGPEHPSVFETMTRLGHLYKDQDRLTEAEQMYQQALRGHENSIGPENIWTLGAVCNLAILHTRQDRLAQAEKMYKRALEGFERSLGLEANSTLIVVANMALLYTDQGNLSDAEKSWKRALEGFQNTLGSDHKMTVSVTDSLGNLYKEQNRLLEAEQLYLSLVQEYDAAFRAHKIIAFINSFDSVRIVPPSLDAFFQNQAEIMRAMNLQKTAWYGLSGIYGCLHSKTLDAKVRYYVLSQVLKKRYPARFKEILVEQAAENRRRWPLRGFFGLGPAQRFLARFGIV